VSRTVAVRWALATTVFVAVAWYGRSAGHDRALLVLVVLLIIVAVFGGTRRS
jgi:hypothetical protein